MQSLNVALTPLGLGVRFSFTIGFFLQKGKLLGFHHLVSNFQYSTGKYDKDAYKYSLISYHSWVKLVIRGKT